MILRRLGLSIPLLFVVTFLTFFLNSLAPGDLACTMMQGEGSEAQYQELRRELGLGYTPLWSDPKAWLLGLILPVVSVSLISITTIAKQTRATLNHGFFSYTAISRDSEAAAEQLCADLRALLETGAMASAPA